MCGLMTVYKDLDEVVILLQNSSSCSQLFAAGHFGEALLGSSSLPHLAASCPLHGSVCSSFCSVKQKVFPLAFLLFQKVNNAVITESIYVISLLFIVSCHRPGNCCTPDSHSHDNIDSIQGSH